jgi:hypothetical protein
MPISDSGSRDAEALSFGLGEQSYRMDGSNPSDHGKWSCTRAELQFATQCPPDAPAKQSAMPDGPPAK